MNWVPVPILLSLATAILCAGLIRWRRAQICVSLLGSSATAAAAGGLLLQVREAGPQVHVMGGWAPPFGIVLVADLLSSSLVALASVVAFLSLLYSAGYLGEQEARAGFHPLFHFLLMGIHGAFLTGDIFNLFVFFEVLLLASYSLVAYGGTGVQLEATLKYATLNLVGSAVFLLAVGALYGLTGTLNMAHLPARLGDAGSPPVVLTIFLLFLLVFGTKAAAFPLQFWLPDAHSSAPTPISAMLSGVLIKVGAYAILRLGGLVFAGVQPLAQPVLLGMAAATMLVGALGALAQRDVKRLLAYSSISQMGYILMGVGLFTPGGLQGALLLILNHALGKALLFLAAGHAVHAAGTRDMRAMGGLRAVLPGTSAAFLVGVLAIAGVPPLPGFFAKLTILQALLAAGHPVLAALAAAMALATLLYLFRAWQWIFWGTAPKKAAHPVPVAMRMPVAVLALLLALVTATLGPVSAWLTEVAAQVRSSGTYVGRVLGAADSGPGAHGGGPAG
jgi:multicomponent Na+:H+ antiporter subunit D